MRKVFEKVGFKFNEPEAGVSSVRLRL